MNENDPFETWKRERRAVPLPADFTDRVMGRLRALPPTGGVVVPLPLPLRHRTGLLLALVASVSLVLAFQTALVGALVFAMPGVAL